LLFSVSITSVHVADGYFDNSHPQSNTAPSRYWGNDISMMAFTNTIEKNKK